MKKIIDLSAYNRAEHFRYFNSLENPYFGVTVNVDVSELIKYCKRRDRSFYSAFMHAAALAADSIPEFRRRIEDGNIIEYDECPTSHTELLDNGAYCYCTLHHHIPTDEYFTKAEMLKRAAREQGSIEEDEDVGSMYFITSLPWLHYTSLVQPTGKDSNPRISWGKYEETADKKYVMPVSVLVHHGLVDGIHAAEFYRLLDIEISKIVNDN